MFMSTSDPIITNPAVALAIGDAGYLAYDIGRERLYRLNASASLIVELSDGTRDRAGIHAELDPILSEPDRAACTTWIDQALADGILLYASDVSLPLPDADEFGLAAADLRGRGEVLAAFVCQDHAVTLDPDQADFWSTLGELAHITGRRERAREAYEQYLEMAPGDAEVEQILIALRDEPPPPRASNRCIEQLYARFAAGYESNMCGDLDYQAPARIGEALDAHVDGGNLDVLELGSGTGLAGPILRRRARTLVGIDLSPAMLEHARATGAYDEVVVAEITSWLEQNVQPFDLVVACDTLIYFGDLRQVLVPAARTVRPGGSIVFTLERATAAPDFVLTDSGRYAHSARHIGAAAKDAGLTVVSVTEGFLRDEYGEPVTGLIAVLRRP